MWASGRAVPCRAVAQAVSRWLPTVLTRVRTLVKSCDGQSGTKAGSQRALRLPLPLIRANNCSTIITIYLRIEVFTAVTMKNGVFWDATPSGSCKNRRFEGTYSLHHQGDKNR
jgi:hypothetical protein